MMHWPRGIVALLGVLAALQLSAVRSLADEPPATVVPSWLTPMAEYRFRVEGFYGGRFQADNDDTYALNRLRFGGTIHAADWFRAVVQLQDARVFLANGTPGPPFRDRLDARLAYAEIGGGTGSGLSTRAGRQELVFGDQRLIGNADWLNTGRTFDGIRTTWRRDRLSLDGFAVYTVKVVPDRINRLDPGSILFGSYAVIPKLIPRFAIDGYFIGRRSPQQITESGGTATLHSGTAGARWNSKPFRGVETGGEMAGQFGSIGDTPLRAWAGHWEVACTLAGARYRPRFASEYNFASGDRNKTDGRRQTFDQLFATGHDKYGLSDQVGWRNIHHIREGVQLYPSTRWQASVRYHSWWLASTSDALYDASGNAIVPATAGVTSRHVGQEIDAQAIVAASRRLSVAGGFAHIFPGSFLEAATPGHSYSRPYASINVGF
jgi:alginate export protein